MQAFTLYFGGCMKLHLLAAIVLSGALGVACAQDAPPPPAPGGSGQAGTGQAGTGRQGRRGGPGGGMGGMMGRGTIGTVTEAAADHYTIKTELGETYTVYFSANTRILKQPPG